MAKPVRVRSFLPDGTVMLEDGREMQAVMASNGALGVRPKVIDDHISAIDQHAPMPAIDLSGLDQT